MAEKGQVNFKVKKVDLRDVDSRIIIDRWKSKGALTLVRGNFGQSESIPTSSRAQLLYESTRESRGNTNPMDYV